jgi:hypothetical protein
MLSVEEIKLDEVRKLFVLDLKVFDNKLEKIIDEYLCMICEGDSGSSLADVKLRFVGFLAHKTSNTAFGAVAEFFLHLFLTNNGFKQDFLFFNLEENSIKKGFDGVFTQSGEIYLVESKSSIFTSKQISHKGILKKASSDLVTYLNGTSKKGRNNPWRNAYNHASHGDVASKKEVKDKLKKLAGLYDNKVFSDVKIFNVIPSSTVFSGSISDRDFSQEIIDDHKFIYEMEGKTITAISITNNTFCNFVSYLRGGVK